LAPEEKQDPLIGAILADRYQILDVLGQGGWGVVYHGVHTLMDRDVAIKLLHARFLEEDTTRKRFQQEAQAVSRLSHPNIIGVHDFGMTPEGHHFLIMDLVKGTTLASILDQEGFLSVERALPIFIQVCSGLAHAHENGIIHRDLKPSNIMIVPVFEGEDMVKILDFGVAKVTPKGGGRAQQLTLTGEIFGTSLYLSPEQCMGRPLDARSDIYALGCVMYEVVTGLPPHIGENLLDTLQKHIADAVVPLRTAREGTDIPEQLDAIVLKALEKEPSDRYQTALALKHALEQVKLALDSKRLTLPLPGQEPLMPLNYSPPYSAVEIAADPYVPGAWNGPGSNIADQNFAITNPAEMGSQVSDQPAAANQSLSPQATLQSPTGPGAPAEQSITQGGAAPGASPLFPSFAQRETVPIKAAESAGSISATAKLPIGRTQLIAMICTGAVLGGLGAWFASTQLRPAQVSSQSQTVGSKNESGDDKVWSDLQRAGQEAFTAGKYEEAEKKFLDSTKLAEKFGEQDRRLTRSLRSLSDVYYTQGKDGQAEQVDRRITALRERQRGSKTESVVDQPDQPADTAGIANNKVSDRLASLARVCHQGGQCEKAEELLQRSVDISKKAFGPNSPQVAERLNDLAAFYLSMGMYDKAEPLYQKVLQTQKAAPDATKGLAKSSIRQYARLLRETDRAAEAKKIEAGAKGI